MFKMLLDEMGEECQVEPWVALFESFRRSLFNFPSLTGDDADLIGPRVLEEETNEEVMNRIYSEIINK